MNPDLQQLQAYPFEKLAALKAGIVPPDQPPILLSIGEPKHPTPAFIREALIENLDGLARYPATRGEASLRVAIADWLQQRFQLPSLNPDSEILPVSGTREALFAFAQCVVDRSQPDPCVLMPNPFYQVYEGAALLAGARPVFLNCTAETGFVPDFAAVTAEVWRNCQLLYLCSPGNPTGAVLDLAQLQTLIALADEYDFVIAADECYSELYYDETAPPPGLLQAAALMGRDDYRRCVVFHSLSKRSSVPGLRSGFVAGDAAILQDFFRYRTYQGCALPPPTQAASTVAWRDETHVRENRALYRQKFAAVTEILQPVLPLTIPPAGFYLWPRLPQPGVEFTRALFAAENVTLLPGSYLSRPTPTGDPGVWYARIALVAPLAECIDAAERIRRFLLK